MKKTITSLMFCIVLQLSYSQGYTFKLTDGDTITQDEIRMLFLSKYIDSLNNVTSKDVLPDFIYDHNFDNKHFGYWGGEHTAISLRAIIFKHVNNKLVLQFISKIKNAQLDQKPNAENDMPFSSFSNRELAIIRLNELKNEQRMNGIYKH